jgi:hypothetical protein
VCGTAGVCEKSPTKISQCLTLVLPPTEPQHISRVSSIYTRWQHHELNPETRFDIVGPFREDEDAKWARKQFRRRHLMPLLQPAHEFFHPRFVRLFYQNMTFDSDKPGVLASTIMGVGMEITVQDIVEATGCPHECPSDKFIDPAPEADLHYIIQDMCDGEYADSRRNCAAKSKLPSRLWLVDTILKRNVYTFGHKTHRIGDLLAALYAFHKRYWFSAPQLIWKQMFKCWEDKVDKGLIGPNRPALPFPFLVTKLVLSKGLALSEDDFLTYEFPVFGYNQWTLSISHLPRRDPVGAPDAEMEDAAARSASC